MVTIRYTGDALWERIERAVEKVKDRLRRVSAALDEANIPYAVVGGNAVQIWVSQVDEGAVRNTRDVDILLKRDTLPAAIVALEPHGFFFQEVAGVSMFLDGPDGKPSEAVHIIFAGEKVRAEYHDPAPEITDREFVRETQTVSLESLVRMKLTSDRDKDRVHVRDMIGVGLVNATWTTRFSSQLAERLQHLLDTPDG
ncbi:MAG: nucleotidyltransferase family protein [Planctomycetes bacterium]|nr:nucleotidyltransferase family protein [Planctomycetota bacterium]